VRVALSGELFERGVERVMLRCLGEKKAPAGYRGFSPLPSLARAKIGRSRMVNHGRTGASVSQRRKEIACYGNEALSDMNEVVMGIPSPSQVPPGTRSPGSCDPPVLPKAGASPLRQRRLRALRQALEAAGVRFLAKGVKLFCALLILLPNGRQRLLEGLETAILSAT
jgi:hypothetical protein